MPPFADRVAGFRQNARRLRRFVWIAAAALFAASAAWAFSTLPFLPALALALAAVCLGGPALLLAVNVLVDFADVAGGGLWFLRDDGDVPGPPLDDSLARVAARFKGEAFALALLLYGLAALHIPLIVTGWLVIPALFHATILAAFAGLARNGAPLMADGLRLACERRAAGVGGVDAGGAAAIAGLSASARRALTSAGVLIVFTGLAVTLYFLLAAMIMAGPVLALVLIPGLPSEYALFALPALLSFGLAWYAVRALRAGARLTTRAVLSAGGVPEGQWPAAARFDAAGEAARLRRAGGRLRGLCLFCALASALAAALLAADWLRPAEKTAVPATVAVGHAAEEEAALSAARPWVGGGMCLCFALAAVGFGLAGPWLRDGTLVFADGLSA